MKKIGIIFIFSLTIFSCQKEIRSGEKFISINDIQPKASYILEPQKVKEVSEEIIIKEKNNNNIIFQDREDDDFGGIGIDLDSEVWLSIEQELDINQDTVFAVGDTIHYVITLANLGSILSGKYKVENIIPAGCNFIDVDSNGSEKAGIITWNEEPVLKPGDELELRYSIQIQAEPTIWSKRYEE